ncbi:MAG: hypothetical protein QOF77_2028 [Solirubrobacteraceae bacterium]|jgi:hypothetical protein|nr:hypothetical protein [Solirubrobacteraceae bacterium]
MFMRRALALVGLLLVLGGCDAASGRVSPAGITGRVVVGPVCPVETMPPLPGCAPRPLAVTLHLRALGRRGPVIGVRSGADGRFRVVLSPGSYRLHALPRPGSTLPRPPAELTVKVHAGRFTSVTISYDSGIR